MKRIALAVCLLFLLAIPMSAQAIGLEVAVGGWYQDPGGDISYEGLTSDDTLDIESNLKYEGTWQFSGRAKIDMPLLIPNVYLMATPMKFDGTGQKTVNFKFGDYTFQQGIDFYSKVELNHYDIGLYYGLPFIRTATAKKLNVDLGLNLRIVDFEAEVRQDATGLQESESLTVPIPMLYVGVQVKPIKRIALEGEGRGLMISNNKYYSLIARVKCKVFGPAFVAGGYRYDHIDIDESDVRLNTTIDGFFFEVGAEF